MKTELTQKIKKIKLLLLDVDGVLTGGQIIYDDRGREIKIFNVKDGLGIRLLIQAGIEAAIITGRRSDALIYRCRDLGIERICDNVADKSAVFESLLIQSNLKPHQTAFIGDDLPDLAVMKKAGVSFAVADAHALILEQADITTSAIGGAGAVREVCELILQTRGLWQEALQQFS